MTDSFTDSFGARPLRSAVRRVPGEWIDYNGHMNVAYYTMAIDRSMDDIFDELGIGERLARERGMGPMVIVNQIHFLDELLEGQEFRCDLQLLDADHKRLHYFVTMHHLSKGTVAATYEGLTVNVDLAKRRSTPYPEDIRRRLEALRAAHAALPRPARTGASIGIRRG